MRRVHSVIFATVLLRGMGLFDRIGVETRVQAEETPAPIVLVLAPSRPVVMRLLVQVDERPGPLLAFESRPSRLDEAPGLFGRLDLNRDGFLSEDELKKARQTLASLDADDDETISLSELNVGQKKTSSGDMPSEPSLSPILLIDSGALAEGAAQRLLAEYDSNTDARGRRCLPPTVLGPAGDVLRRFDRDGNGLLDAEELTRWLLETTPQVDLSVHLFDRERDAPQVSAQPTDHSLGFEFKPANGEAATIVLNGLEIAVAAKRTLGSKGDRRRFYLVRFRIVDKDRNHSLDRDEFRALGLPDASFESVDSNRDGKIVLSELTKYLGGDAAAADKRVVVTVTDQSQPLFDYLDTRPDRRLSPRELNAAAARLHLLDRNNDGRIAKSELRTHVLMQIAIKRTDEPKSGKPGPRRLIVRRDQPPALPPHDRGPQWFLRMDRNYDGDVSWREFLGSRQAFDQLDADHDGLISPEEAERIK